ncbi:MAG TPA: TraR/DksA C4-type zinc finger protein, partial [Nitrospira sp.]|nr:TraR/DksA C4-type zinc finger protein [Nitrospira sp.]
MKTRASAKRTKRTAASSLATKRATRTTSTSGKYSAIRRDLQKQRQAILEEAGEGLTKREGPEAFPDVSDQASAEVDQNFSMRIKEREQKLLKKIDEALDRLKKNVFGICERCEEEIPYQRLKARPVTTLCIACKTLQEQEEKIRR